MLRIAGPYSRRGRWLAFAADGTRMEAPHTAANEDGPGLRRPGQDRPAGLPDDPLAHGDWLALGLPRRAGHGQRTHPPEADGAGPAAGALVVADAGFVGYGLCLRLLRHGRHFLLRVGGNITLLKGLGYYHEERDGLVYLWPQKHRRGRPLVLRLIVLRHGKQDVYLLTDVLDPAQLTDDEAATLFGMRWGEEVFYRSYKQTLQRRKLLSRTRGDLPGRGAMDVAGAVAVGADDGPAAGRSGGPTRWRSRWPGPATRCVVRCGRAGPARPPEPGGGCVRPSRMATSATTSKAARNYPRKKRREAAGAAQDQIGDGGGSQTGTETSAARNTIAVDGVGCRPRDVRGSTVWGCPRAGTARAGLDLRPAAGGRVGRPGAGHPPSDHDADSARI